MLLEQGIALEHKPLPILSDRGHTDAEIGHPLLLLIRLYVIDPELSGHWVVVVFLFLLYSCLSMIELLMILGRKLELLTGIVSSGLVCGRHIFNSRVIEVGRIFR